MGSIRALTDGSGTVQNTYQYDAYGSTTSSTGSVANPFRYAGEYRDSESGLYYLRARYYDPSTQQFLTRDPLLAITGQGYNYAKGSPINATDPDGLRVRVTRDQVDSVIQSLLEQRQSLENWNTVQGLTWALSMGLAFAWAGGEIAVALDLTGWVAGFCTVGAATVGGTAASTAGTNADIMEAAEGVKVVDWMINKLQLLKSVGGSYVDFWLEDWATDLSDFMKAVYDTHPGNPYPYRYHTLAAYVDGDKAPLNPKISIGEQIASGLEGIGPQN